MKKPTVTELLDILNKPALLSWANKLGLSGESIKGYRKKVFSDGNKKHNEIERYLLYGELMEDESKMRKIDILFSGCTILSIEESFENEFYMGRCDIIFKKNGLVYISDFKRKFKVAYLEHHLQLICYKMHFGCDRIGIIGLDNFEFHEIELSKEELYKELIGNLINIYNIKQQL